MLLYIHGYQGSPGDKFDRVVRVFGGLYEDIRGPQLSNVSVASDLARLRELLPEEDGRPGRPHLFVGNSLGGFYAWHLCRQRTDAMCLLINPALAPFILLNREAGAAPDFLRDLLRCFSESYLNGRFPRTWAAYCLDDEVIGHGETTVPILRPVEGRRETGAVLIPVERGGHGFTDTKALEAVFDRVRQDIEDSFGPGKS